MAKIWKAVWIGVVILLIAGLLLGGAGLLTGASADRVQIALADDLIGFEAAYLNIRETVSGLLMAVQNGAG